MPVTEKTSQAPQPLRLLLLQPDQQRSGRVVAELEKAGFEVTAEFVDVQEAFDSKLRAGTYDLAINGLQPTDSTKPFPASSPLEALMEICPLAIISLDL